MNRIFDSIDKYIIIKPFWTLNDSMRNKDLFYNHFGQSIFILKKKVELGAYVICMRSFPNHIKQFGTSFTVFCLGLSNNAHFFFVYFWCRLLEAWNAFSTSSFLSFFICATLFFCIPLCHFLGWQTKISTYNVTV